MPVRNWMDLGANITSEHSKMTEMNSKSVLLSRRIFSTFRMNQIFFLILYTHLQIFHTFWKKVPAAYYLYPPFSINIKKMFHTSKNTLSNFGQTSEICTLREKLFAPYFQPILYIFCFVWTRMCYFAHTQFPMNK